MWSNNLKIALRNFRRQAFFSLINVSGLSVGLAVALLIGLYVRDEWSFDRYNEKADRIYRLNMDVRFGGQEQAMAVVPAPMGGALVRDYPAVETMCRFRQTGFITVKKGEEAIEEGDNSYVDSTFFKVFTAPLLEGDPQTALAEPNTGVISARVAQKYFGTTTGVIGRTLRINENRDMRVTGVMRNLPSQSHFHYDFLFSMSSLPEEANSDMWLSNNFQTYLLLRPGASAADLENHFEELTTKYVAPQFEKFTGSTMSALQANGDWLKYSLISLRDIHLRSHRVAEQDANSDIKYVWIFSSVALMVLLLACVNFMNLSTARSAGRAREVGVRKALGSNRSALVRQFLMESLVLTCISFGLAVVVVRLSLSTFNHFAAKDITFSVLDLPMLGALAGLALLTSFFAGLYPAFFLSSFRPIEVLKGKVTLQSRNSGTSWLRSGLVVFQFFISVSLIASVLVVQKQLDYIQHKKLGYEKERLVMLRNTWWLQQKTEDFKDQLLQIPGVENVSASSYFPTPSSRTSTNFTEAGKDLATQSVSSQHWRVDFNYQPTFGLSMHEGRWFDRQLKTDSLACILNESAVKIFGWSDPVGHKVSTFINEEATKTATYEVIGVVEDFNYESLRQKVGPLIMTIGRESGTMAIRVAADADMEKTLAAIGTLFKSYLPAQPYNYRFVDEEFDTQYKAEQRIGSILGAFAGFAIFIACLGLFGLAAFTAEQRTKEIGIRKVLGASVTGITGLLARDFMKLVLVAIVVASPLAWWAMHKWLEDFAYRIELQWWTFALAGLAAVGIAFLTVSFQSIKAALANPVKSLRSE